MKTQRLLRLLVRYGSGFVLVAAVASACSTSSPSPASSAASPGVTESGTASTIVVSENEVSPGSVTTVTAAGSFVGMTFEQQLEDAGYVLVVRVLEVSEPTWNSANGEAWSESDGSKWFPESFQLVSVVVEDIVTTDGRSFEAPLIEAPSRSLGSIVDGEVIDITYSVTFGGGLVLPPNKELVDSRVLMAVGYRDFGWQDGTIESVVSAGQRGSWIEVDGLGVRLADAFEDAKWLGASAIISRFANESPTLSSAPFEELLRRANSTDVPLEDHLGYEEVYGPVPGPVEAIDPGGP